MNSEQWEQLWQEQTVPASPVNLDRFHRSLATEPGEWERDIDVTERLLLKLVWLGSVLSLPAVFFGDPTWGAWLRLLAHLLFAAWLMLRQFQRRRIYRDFGLPLRDRLDRMERLLHERHESWLTVAVPIGIMTSFGLSLLTTLGRAGVGSIGSGVVLTGLLALTIWACRAQRHLDRKKLREAIGRIEQARSELGGDLSSGH